MSHKNAGAPPQFFKALGKIKEKEWISLILPQIFYYKDIHLSEILSWET